MVGGAAPDEEESPAPPDLGDVSLDTASVLYCTVLYCTVLYCTVLYCTVLYCMPGDNVKCRSRALFSAHYQFVFLSQIFSDACLG